MRVTVFVKRRADDPAQRCDMSRSAALRSKEVADQPLFFFIFDAREELGAESDDCLWLVERQTVVHFAVREMARLTSCLKDRINLGIPYGSRTRVATVKGTQSL